MDEKVVLPVSVNSLKFAASRCVEIAAMTESILRPSKTKLIFQTLPVHMRRRVMSHNCKRLPKNLREGHLEQLKKSGLPPKQKRPSRKYRRRPANLLEEYTKRQRRIAWLETHIWHAKRFHMIERWGYRLPHAPCDKAFRACYRATSAHCLIQDISYYIPIKIKGTVKNIGNYFSKFTNPCTGLSICAKAFLNGNREGSISLFKSNTFPLGYICKVNFIWEPCHLEEKCLWLFVHPAAIKDVESILCPTNKGDDYETAAKRIKTDNDSSLLNVEILPGRLNRFSLTGPNSHAILTKSLKCIENIEQVKSNLWISGLNPSTQLHLNEKHNYWNKISLVSSPATLPKGIVIGLTVRDPRFSRPNKRTKAVHNSQQCDTQTLLDIPKYASTSPLWEPQVLETLKKNTMTNGQFIKHITQTQLVPGEVFLEDPALQSIPIVLIQRPGSQNPQHKKIGYGSGWDIIIPSGYALPFWLTFIMYGARSGGLRESENMAYELGENYFHPDSDAGRMEEKRIENEIRERYFRRPPSKRVNFIKLGIKSPFRCPWNVLLKDWAHQPTDSNFSNYFVLRDKKILQILQENLRNRKNTQQIPESAHCLIPVYIKLSGKGSLSNHALICEPQLEDLTSLQTLFEPQHIDHCEVERKLKRKDHIVELKQMRKKRQKIKRKQVVSTTTKRIKKKSPQITEYMKQMRELWVPSDIQSVRNHGTRQVLGFISKGSFSFTEAKSCGVGYLTYNGLCSLLEKGLNKVLIRNITSRKYRLGQIEIIQDV